MSNQHPPTLRVIKILEVISLNEGLTQTQIAAKLSLPPGTLFPILKTLLENNFVKLENNAYMIGFKNFYLGVSYYKNWNFQKIIREELQELTNSVGEISQLGILIDTDVFYIQKVETRNPIEIVSEIGKRVPSYATGLGKAILAHKNDDTLKALFKDIHFKQFTKNTISNFKALLEELHKIRERGYALDDQESALEVKCIAVPIKTNDEVKMAISVTYPKFRESKEKTEIIKRKLFEKKEALENIFLVKEFKL